MTSESVRPTRVVLPWPDAGTRPEDITAAHVFVDARRLTDTDVAQLARLRRLTHLELSGYGADLAPLAQCPHLEHLRLTDPGGLTGLERLTSLTSLTLYAFPRVQSLAAVAHLNRLKRLHLSTPPGYDASGKCHHVESLEPIAHLKVLEHLVMRGILPHAGGLTPLHRLQQLQTLDISHVNAFGLVEYASLARALPAATGHCLVPWFEATWTGVCRKCGGPRVALTGPPPRTPRMLCPRCNAARLAEHTRRWNEVLAAKPD